MSTDRDVTRIVRSWLHEDAHEDADRVLGLVLDEIDTTPQRRAIGLARRFPIVNNTIRIAVAAAAVLVVAFVGYQLMAGPSVGNPSPSPSASAAPSAAQSAGPSELPFGGTTLLNAGTYSLGDQFPVQVTFEVPANWTSCSQGPTDQGVCSPPSDTYGMGVSFLIVENVVADPCGSSRALLDPPVGPTVDDLVTALSGLEGFEATAPTDLTVDGFRGKEFTLTAPAAGAGCATWATETRTNGVGPGEVTVLRILDVEGTRLVITGAHGAGAPEANAAALQVILASVQIEP
jgi:hypothetical protein